MVPPFPSLEPELHRLLEAEAGAVPQLRGRADLVQLEDQPGVSLAALLQPSRWVLSADAHEERAVAVALRVFDVEVTPLDPDAGIGLVAEGQAEGHEALAQPRLVEGVPELVRVARLDEDHPYLGHHHRDGRLPLQERLV